MIDFRLGRYALGLGVAVAMLAGCGGHASNGVVPVDGVPNSLANHKSFYYTGGAQDFTVPAGVTQLKVVARGARGAGSPKADGGRVHAVIPVTPGEKLVVYVGGDATELTGGFNGGGSSGVGSRSIYSGFGGGGASDVRQGGDKLVDRILVAGGGGGQGGRAPYYSYLGGVGGEGGGYTGGSGANGPYSGGGGGGGGGTQHSGGSGGSGGYSDDNPGSDGSLGAGGIGGTGCSGSTCAYGGGGGGGGGGYYGGGGGGTGFAKAFYGNGGGGGGGGSSYAESSATNVHMWQGWKQSAHNGLVVFSW